MASAASSDLSIRPPAQKIHSKFTKKKHKFVYLELDHGLTGLFQSPKPLYFFYLRAKLPDHHSFWTLLATRRRPASSYARCTPLDSIFKMPATITTPTGANRAKILSRALISKLEIRFAQITEYLGPTRENFVTFCSKKWILFNTRLRFAFANATRMASGSKSNASAGQ